MDNNKQIVITEPVILFRINQAYRNNMSDKTLYDYTRGMWRMSMARAKKASYAFAVFDGIIKEVYSIIKWYRAGETLSYRDNKLIERLPNERIRNRIEFIGEIAEDEIRDKYVNKSVKHFFKQGNSNPVMYLNC